MAKFIEYGIISEPSSYSNHTNKYEMGWSFVVGNEDINVSGLRIKLPNAQTENANLWSSSGSLLRSVNINAIAGEWSEAYFDEPITLVSGNTYVISFYNNSNRYSSNSSSFTFNPKITYISGRHNSKKGNFPSKSEGNNVYPIIDIIIDTTPPFDRKYLVMSNGIIYNIMDGVLTALEASELTSGTFQTYGFDEVPDWSFISELTNPEVLYWLDSNDELPTLNANMTATPFPQTVVSPNYDMSHDTVLGVECAYVTASSDVVFAISVDDGVTWHMWTGQAWGTLTDTATGMSAETINAITTEQWAGLMTTGQFKVRMTLFDENSSFTSFTVDYIN